MKPIRLTKRERRAIEQACDEPMDVRPRLELHTVIEALLTLVAIGGFVFALWRNGYFT